MPLNLDSKVSELAGVGQKYEKKLKKLGIETIRDFLFYFPWRWEDFSKITKIRDVKVGEQVSVCGKVIDIATKRSRRGIPVTEAIIADETATAKAVWFNQPFIEKNIRKGEKIFLAGKMEWGFGQLNFVSPDYEKEKDAQDQLRHTGRIVPVYHETEGITSRWLRQKIGFLNKLIYNIRDHLPNEVKEKHNLLDLSAAVRAIHFPESFEEIKKAQERFLYDNLFCLFLAVLQNQKNLEKNKSIAIDYNEEAGKKFIKSLPFELTDAQRKAAWEILKDLKKPIPANRLLEGDVGSGKTVVAALASLMVAKAGHQVAFLAPTEILARQHYENFKKFFKDFPDIKISLFTGSLKNKQKREIIDKLKNGETQIVIGTHSLISEKVEFWSLAFVIIDEQHRFGINQRMSLKKANGQLKIMPHFLSMSATPIPRTLAITVFGDLRISVLDEIPKGRKKVKTFVVPPFKREDAYKFIEEKLAQKQQAFVICPLISKSDRLGVKSVEDEVENLRRIFKKRKVFSLHGKLKSEEKEQIMKDFREGKIDILVSTSIVEVGVDIPNASIMMVEGADRFGLAQLHQFRGRVGRGEHESFCLLFSESKKEDSLKRLQALAEIDNGFDLAEKDLEFRGPGELLGTKQHGKIDKTLLEVIKKPLIIRDVRETAEDFLSKNSISDFPLLAEKVKDFEIASKLE